MFIEGAKRDQFFDINRPKMDEADQHCLSVWYKCYQGDHNVAAAAVHNRNIRKHYMYIYIHTYII